MRPLPVKALRRTIEELAAALKAILEVVPDADFVLEVAVSYDLDRDSELTAGGDISAIVPVGTVPANVQAGIGYKRAAEGDGDGTLTLRVSRIGKAG